MKCKLLSLNWVWEAYQLSPCLLFMRQFFFHAGGLASRDFIMCFGHFWWGSWLVFHSIGAVINIINIFGLLTFSGLLAKSSTEVVQEFYGLIWSTGLGWKKVWWMILFALVVFMWLIILDCSIDGWAGLGFLFMGVGFVFSWLCPVIWFMDIS